MTSQLGKRACVAIAVPLWIGFLTIGLNAGCQEKSEGDVQTAPETPKSEAAAIRHVFQRDESLAQTRNEAAKTVGVGEAARIYATSLEELDYDGTPSEFQSAYRKHADAWMEVAEHVEETPELNAARGEMHAVFEELLASDGPEIDELRKRMDEMWSTWREVETVAREHGVTME